MINYLLKQISDIYSFDIVQDELSKLVSNYPNESELSFDEIKLVSAAGHNAYRTTLEKILHNGEYK